MQQIQACCSPNRMKKQGISELDRKPAAFCRGWMTDVTHLPHKKSDDFIGLRGPQQPQNPYKINMFGVLARVLRVFG